MFKFTDVAQQNKVLIPRDKRIVVVADYFVEDLIGGAELTTEELCATSPFYNQIYKIHSEDVSIETLQDSYDRTIWIFGNWTKLRMDLLPTIAQNMKYAILEYDYKFCKFRNPSLHKLQEGECSCSTTKLGEFVSFFYERAHARFWMSEAQLHIYEDALPRLRDGKNIVLSSVFSPSTLEKIGTLRQKYEFEKEPVAKIISSNSWVKGTAESIAEAERLGLPYRLIGGIDYDSMLEEIASAQHVVYMPPGEDTCPRFIIEAKLLGCTIHMNENVQHASEEWFSSSSITDIEEYLLGAPNLFWSTIAQMNKEKEISGYVTVRNCIDQGYDIKKCLLSLANFCSEIIVVDGGSTDSTVEYIKGIGESIRDITELKIYIEPRDWTSRRSALYDGELKALARSYCTRQLCWQQDADEWVKITDVEKIKFIAANTSSVIALPVIEFWGRHKIRLDVTPWKWRLSPNDKDITHGVPSALRRWKQLPDGSEEMYAAPGTDGCDIISATTGEPLEFISFYGEGPHRVRLAALSGNATAQKEYATWLSQIMNALPVVYHDSWVNIERKIRLYRDFWSRHWDVLYSDNPEATQQNPSNNFFPGVKWDDVTEEMIRDLAQRLENDTGGWIFHSPWRGESVPYLTLESVGLSEDTAR